MGTMEYLDLAGAVVALSSTICFVRANKLAWPLCLGSSVLNVSLFLKVHLIGQVYLHSFYFITSIIGWLMLKTSGQNWVIHSLSKKIAPILALGAATVLCFVYRHLAIDMPAELARYDAIILVGAISAQLLTTMRIKECWLLWLVVDITSIMSHTKNELPFHMIQHTIYIGTATMGMIHWHKLYRSKDNQAALEDSNSSWLTA